MQTWDTKQLSIEPHKPQILSSSEARVIALNLPAGEELQEHEVHEEAILIVVDGRVDVAAEGEQAANGGPGFVAHFAAHERHDVRAAEDARLLLVLAPWPGDGHPGAMNLEDKATARERAHERAAG